MCLCCVMKTRDYRLDFNMCFSVAFVISFQGIYINIYLCIYTIKSPLERTAFCGVTPLIKSKVHKHLQNLAMYVG